MPRGRKHGSPWPRYDADIDNQLVRRVVILFFPAKSKIYHLSYVYYNPIVKSSILPFRKAPVFIEIISTPVNVELNNILVVNNELKAGFIVNIELNVL